ncbi:MAG: ABC transporter ATP-binding protein [Rhodospirillales bacterium]|nr:ABC transporter ATP-binding protein [Rhodospirillales bacterium]
MTGEPVIRTDGLTRRFGALTAVDAVSLEFTAGRIHAVIGPNGAGKTTFLNLLSGNLRPTTGSVRLRGREIAGAPVHAIARLGVGRSYQRTNVFPEFTCFENCRLGAQARLSSSMRFFKPADAYAGVNADAERALSLCRLSHRRDDAADVLSHGERRQLELGMMLATSPSVLLLDEPLAGMGAAEAGLMLDLIKGLASDHTIVLVEHDMDAVFSTADVITVMVGGRALETGTPAAIQVSPAVREAYLGAAKGAPAP